MFTVQQILEATGGRLTRGDALCCIYGVSTDSRQVRPGDIFIAICGENFDGHAFVNDVVRKGAVAVIVSRPVTLKRTDVPVIRVKDTVRALGHLAHAHRMRFDIPVIAVTGSAGKTTTKELITAVLNTRYRVLKNEGTQNNHIGVPLTLLKLQRSHQAVVVECGTNQPGDISWLASIVQPTITVLTNIGPSHLEKLKSPRGVFLEKIVLARATLPNGCVILNKDDRLLASWKKAKDKVKVMTYGIRNVADIRASGITAIDGARMTFAVNKMQNFIVRTPVFDNVYNALAAICCGRVLKIGYNKIYEGLRRFGFQGNRQGLMRVGGVWILNDTYNANPVSVRSALTTLKSLPVQGRRIFILADMLELGAQSARWHRLVGRDAARAGLQAFFSVGNRAGLSAREARKVRRTLDTRCFKTQEQLQGYLRGKIRSGDAVLVKGSRRMKMERTVEFLKDMVKGT